MRWRDLSPDERALLIDMALQDHWPLGTASKWRALTRLRSRGLVRQRGMRGDEFSTVGLTDAALRMVHDALVGA